MFPEWHGWVLKKYSVKKKLLDISSFMKMKSYIKKQIFFKDTCRYKNMLYTNDKCCLRGWRRKKMNWVEVSYPRRELWPNDGCAKNWGVWLLLLSMLVVEKRERNQQISNIKVGGSYRWSVSIFQTLLLGAPITVGLLFTLICRQVFNNDNMMMKM